MSTLNERGQFNGSILVALQANVIYRNAFGYANFQKKIKTTPATPFYIASLAKQFTAMAIMILAEHKKLDYNDRVARYIPDFAGSRIASHITIRQLLTHTSGIPDYGDLDVDDSTLTKTN